MLHDKPVNFTFVKGYTKIVDLLLFHTSQPKMIILNKTNFHTKDLTCKRIFWKLILLKIISEIRSCAKFYIIWISWCSTSGLKLRIDKNWDLFYREVVRSVEQHKSGKKVGNIFPDQEINLAKFFPMLYSYSYITPCTFSNIRFLFTLHSNFQCKFLLFQCHHI